MYLIYVIKHLIFLEYKKTLGDHPLEQKAESVKSLSFNKYILNT